MSNTRAFQGQPLGRNAPAAYRGKVMRPACFTLDMATAFTPPLDAASSVDWTDTSYKMPVRYEDGPFMDDNSQYSIINSSKDVVLGPGIFLIEWQLVVTNSNVAARTVQVALVNEGGTSVYNEYPEVSIPATSDVCLGGCFLSHNGPEDTSDEYAISVVQRNGAGGDLSVAAEIVANVIKIGNSDEGLRLRG